MLKMKDVPFFNPCKYCLTKSMCKDICDDLKMHIDIFDTIYHMIWCVLVGVFEFVIIFYAFKYLYAAPVIAIIITLLITLYSYLYKHIKKETDDFHREKWWFKIIILGLAPVIFPAVYIFENWINDPFNLELKAKNFNLRHNKKLRKG